MHLSLYLLAGILKKTAIVFGAILIVTGFLFLLIEYHLRSSYGPPISGTGTLDYSLFGHGVWYIYVDGGEKYVIGEAYYFPEEFHIDGLRVGFIAYVSLYHVTTILAKSLILVDIWRI